MRLTSGSVAKRKKKWSNAFSISMLRPIFAWETLNLWAALQPSTHWEISTGNGLVLRHLTRLCTGTGLEAVAQKVMILKHWKLVFLRKKVNEEIPEVFLVLKGFRGVSTSSLDSPNGTGWTSPRNTATFTFHSDVKTLESVKIIPLELQDQPTQHIAIPSCKLRWQ